MDSNFRLPVIEVLKELKRAVKIIFIKLVYQFYHVGTEFRSFKNLWSTMKLGKHVLPNNIICISCESNQQDTNPEQGHVDHQTLPRLLEKNSLDWWLQISTWGLRKSKTWNKSKEKHIKQNLKIFLVIEEFIEKLPLEIFRRIYLQQDGASLHDAASEIKYHIQR